MKAERIRGFRRTWENPETRRSALASNSLRAVETGRTELPFVIAVGRKLSNLVTHAECLSTLQVARSISAPPLRVFLYVNRSPAPNDASTSPCSICVVLDSFCDSRTIDPMVPGIKRKRYEYLFFLALRCFAKNVDRAIPDKLSLARD